MNVDWVCACDSPIDARRRTLIESSGAPIVCTPLVVGGRVYLGTDGGQLLVLESGTGQRLETFPSQATLAGEIKHTPLLAGRRLIIGAYDGAAYALRLD